LGWWLLYRRARVYLALGPPSGSAVAGLLLIGLWQWSAPASVSPHYIAYFNPWLGGGAGAARGGMVGHGEGMEQVAEYFNGLANVDELYVAAHSFDLLAARCRCDGEPLRDRAPANADYVVLYGRRIQLRRWGASLEQYLQAREPVRRVVI